MSDNGKRVFISYAHEDRAFARQLGALMEQRGVAVTSNEANATRGRRVDDVLREAIERATALVLLIPQQTVSDRNITWFEAGAAKTLGKPVLAVLPPARTPGSTELPTDLAGLLVLDADRRSLDSIADMLVQAVPGEQMAMATN
ncbi:toll/interleukin-1 receptor domain-containing protein [Rhodopseudomonas sp. B29]|uniref:toll/interleukin-1 receptor domain-containing protein n=1 Tax=Rhodopseudomonas sp. B29 TaxID=95607 RepID=UPI0003456AB5|nr:toll/interleukin-1 receptor domain-containing protein [Rhodopseudomonas sp. B29]